MAGSQQEKTIVVLSTEPWGKMLLSKMHYALELVAKGNKVYFVNPPRSAPGKKLVSVRQVEQAGRLVILDTNETRGSLFFRHKLFFIYRMISGRYVKAIKKIAGGSPDEVWCFDPHLYVDLRMFGAKKAILFLYDFYKGDHVFRAAETADALVSVSRLIMDYYKESTPPKLLLQHGLGAAFAGIARPRLNLPQPASFDGRIRLGYVGNLLRVGMNTDIARKVIERHPDKEFHFYGPYSLKDNNVSGAGATATPDLAAFIEFLQAQPHVMLHGMKDQAALAEELSKMDAFLFLYSQKTDMNAASNSHKLLEYLSTGKVIVSTYVSNYEGLDLLAMSSKEDEDGYPEVFDKVMADLSFYNSAEQQQKRISFALDNTYERQVERIQQFVRS